MVLFQKVEMRFSSYYLSVTLCRALGKAENGQNTTFWSVLELSTSKTTEMDEPKPGTSAKSGGKHDPVPEDTTQDIEVIPVTKCIKLEKHSYDAQKENEEWERRMRLLGLPSNCSASHTIFNVMHRQVTWGHMPKEQVLYEKIFRMVSMSEIVWISLNLSYNTNQAFK